MNNYKKYVCNCISYNFFAKLLVLGIYCLRITKISFFENGNL